MKRPLPLTAMVIGSGAASLLVCGTGPVALSTSSAASSGPSLTALALGDGKTTTTGPQSG